MVGGRDEEERMARRSPLLTLLGGAVLAGGLLVANAAVTGDDLGSEPGGDLAEAGASPTAEPEPAATPSPEPPPEPVTYVGAVDGGGASVAIVINGADATGYVCDGVTEAWLTGAVEAGPRAGELDLRGERGDLTARLDGDSATGQVTADGRSWSFTIEQVAPPEGLYRVADTILGGAEVDGGWIVLPDGTQIGVLTVDGEAQPAPRLDPETGRVTIEGRPVTADRVG
jgi:serine/threonine-protein kinase